MKKTHTNRNDQMKKTIPFSFNGISSSIDIIEKDSRIYFDANAIWEMNEMKDSLHFEKFLEQPTTKQLILETYNKLSPKYKSKLHINANSKSVLNKNIYSITPPNIDIYDNFNAYHVEMDSETNEIDSAIMDFFVIRFHDTKNQVFFDGVLFMEYAMFLSPKLKSHVIDVFQRFGWIDGLYGEEKINMIIGLAGHEMQEQQKLSKGNQILPENIDRNLISIIKKKILKEQIEDLFIETQYEIDPYAQIELLDDFYKIMNETIFEKIFKYKKSVVLKSINLYNNDGYPNQYLSRDALDILNIVEAEILFFIGQYCNAKIKLTKENLMTIINECCDDVSKKVFRVSSQINFLNKNIDSSLTNSSNWILTSDFSIIDESIYPQLKYLENPCSKKQ